MADRDVWADFRARAERSTDEALEWIDSTYQTGERLRKKLLADTPTWDRDRHLRRIETQLERLLTERLTLSDKAACEAYEAEMASPNLMTRLGLTPTKRKPNQP